MHHTPIWQDINTAVRRAINEDLHLLDEADLIAQSDALLENVPIATGTQPTTALLLRRYHSSLHQELCLGNRPRAQFETVEDELRELTRAVLVSIDSSEGISIDSAVLLALVLHRRGLIHFCTLPAVSVAGV